MKERRWKK